VAKLKKLVAKGKKEPEAAAPAPPPKTLYGGPTKRFFVSMLTRDIELDHAILDLIDNSVDGAMRVLGKPTLAKTPYDGFEVKIKISKDSFSIEDNCGGIPDSRLDAAFSLGRPQSDLDLDIPTIGMYGIGMKRSIFKIGNEAIVESSSSDGVRTVTYDKKWMNSESADADNNWDLNIEYGKTRKKRGVMIVIDDVRTEISKQFSNEAHVERLKRRIGIHFGYLILRGFSIYVNRKKITPKTLHLYASREKKKSLNPFDYIGRVNGVRVRVTVGFYSTVHRDGGGDEILTSMIKETPGISVLCNDRVILHNDTTFRTGWGTRTVPKFHTQFVAVAGLISFHSNDADTLPVNTTKTGIDMETEVYEHAVSICAEAIKHFTSFTNKWKGNTKETVEFFDHAQLSDALFGIKLAQSSHAKTKRLYDATCFVPDLPAPSSQTTNRRVSFVKDIKEIKLVSEYLFGEILKPGPVGEECFDRFLHDAKEAK